MMRTARQSPSAASPTRASTSPAAPPSPSKTATVPLLAVPAPARHAAPALAVRLRRQRVRLRVGTWRSRGLVSASLEARPLAAVESLARRGSGDVAGQESVIARTKDQLRDLGGQADSGVRRHEVEVRSYSVQPS